jgi:GTP pyrophosphokinase
MAYGERFVEAVVWASELHRFQVRKSVNVPYVTHLLAVAAIVGENGGSEDEVIAALLHDAVEDQGGPPIRAEIARRFGETVAAIVDGCTDSDQTPKPPWRKRKEAYLAHLTTAAPSVLLVSIADKIHNARSIITDLRGRNPDVWRHFKGGKEGVLWYYRSLVSAYRDRAPEHLVAELDHLVATIEELAMRA